MKKAFLFQNNDEHIEVTAEDVASGKYNRRDQFIDPKYEFRVQFVKGARNNGGPYFRLYYSYEDFKKLYPDRADRYKIVANMRRYEESQWHREWKEKVSHFCLTEECIKNPTTKKWKFADAFYGKTETVIEFQHSYISFYFEERNAFYSDFGYNVIWLYDLPLAHVCNDKEGNIEILEDNARGFFRIAESPDNLKNNFVYIQVKSGMIYRVSELHRRESSIDKKSTIRYFVPEEVYTEAEFIDAIKMDKIRKAYTLQELWKSNYSWMIVRNIRTDETIYINCDNRGEMCRDFDMRCIWYKYTDDKFGEIPIKNRKPYLLSYKKEHEAIWILEQAKEKY